MLYLEDFLEVIENVPQEIREKVSEIRELDAGVHNASDNLEDEMKTYFSNAKKMKPQERTTAYEKIRNDYYKLLEDSDEKVNIAANMHTSLERYVRKLDQELEKFKCELEADSPGITEILEKKSLELDEPSRESQKENRYNLSNSRGMSSMLSNSSEWRQSSIKKEDSDPNLSSSISLSPPPTSLSYSLGHIGPGSNVIAAAASQAIAATQQMRQGRKTASLIASYDAVTQGVFPSDFSIGSELAHAAKAALAASSLPQEPNTTNNLVTSATVTPTSNKRLKKSLRQSNSNSVIRETSPSPSREVAQDSLIDPMSDNPDWTFDPNEPRYCVCNQVSYGDMVACDNPKCPLEWFHYQCVGITAPPKGKWYCPQCASSMNRRQRK